MSRLVIVDMDGTVSNHHHRASQLDIGFDEYNSLLHLDDPIHGVCEIVRKMSTTHLIIFITGRPNKYRAETIDWMRRNDVPHDELYMRPDDDMRSDVTLKAGILMGILDNKQMDLHDITFVLEDRDCVVKMWREMGLTCLQVNNFEIQGRG
jgi:hypothetical protein